MKVIQAFHIVRIALHISDRVTDCIQLIIFRPSTTSTMPLTAQILRNLQNGFQLYKK